jgi:hypothetical protein
MVRPFIILLSILLLTSICKSAYGKDIETEILIQAPAGKVWQILTNFESYPEWNPFIKSLTGEPKKGAKIKVVLAGMRFKASVLVFEQHKEFRWSGHLIFPGLFDGTHRFVLIDNGDGTTTFRQSEKFKGLLVVLFGRKSQEKTKAGFESMNRALKTEAERHST